MQYVLGFILFVLIWVCFIGITDWLVEWSTNHIFRDTQHKFEREIHGISDDDVDTIEEVSQRIWHFIDLVIVTLIFLKIFNMI